MKPVLAPGTFGSVEDVNEKLRSGEISGFRIGQVLTAKRDTFVRCGERFIPVSKGKTLLATLFSKGRFTASVGGKDCSGVRRDFRDGEQVVLDSWK